MASKKIYHYSAYDKETDNPFIRCGIFKKKLVDGEVLVRPATSEYYKILGRGTINGKLKAEDHDVDGFSPWKLVVARGMKKGTQFCVFVDFVWCVFG